ncbi:unnamed protein product [marine sediment metagenome]|uniref:Uncharacterized protein n=1 Tax=marine sediment metagenome TaxID=412755 RepID=X1GCX8_9ZZZZ
MLDENHYPDEKSLKEIAEWDILKHGVQGLLDLVEENTNWPDRQIFITGKKVIHFEYHTGGWSGNEDVINALRQNLLFWSVCWEKSTRGGHYYFKIKPIKVENNIELS